MLLTCNRDSSITIQPRTGVRVSPVASGVEASMRTTIAIVAVYNDPGVMPYHDTQQTVRQAHHRTATRLLALAPPMGGARSHATATFASARRAGMVYAHPRCLAHRGHTPSATTDGEPAGFMASIVADIRYSAMLVSRTHARMNVRLSSFG